MVVEIPRAVFLRSKTNLRCTSDQGIGDWRALVGSGLARVEAPRKPLHLLVTALRRIVPCNISRRFSGFPLEIENTRVQTVTKGANGWSSAQVARTG